MTSVVLNKVGMDLVDIEVQQKGSAFTDIFFQDPVLDYTKEYVLGVSELVVPLGDEPMITQVPYTQEVLRVRRKGYFANNGGNKTWYPLRCNFADSNPGDPHHAASLPAAGSVLPANVSPENDSWSIFRTYYRGLRIQTPSQFLDELNKWATTVNAQLNAQFVREHTSAALGNNVGAQSVSELKILVSPSGRLTVRANADFWRLCYLEFSPFGRELLGAPVIMHVGANGVNDVSAGEFTVGLAIGEEGLPVLANAGVANAADLAGAIFIPSNNLGANEAVRQMTASYSMLRYMEHRLRIEVDADLAIPANILVENEKQKMHYNIASFALPNRYKSEIVMNQADDEVQEEVCIISECHVGDTIIKDKTTPVADWYKLQDSSNLQNMRLHIFVVRRDWDSAKREFVLTRNKLTMNDKSSWKLTLKFVQLF